MISKKFRSRNQAQAALEYAMVVICLVAALFAMQIYIKRSIQGRLRETADSLGEQYAPHQIDSEITITQTGTTTVKVEEAEKVVEGVGRIFGLKTTTTTDETTTRRGYENLDKFEKNLFD